MVSRSSGLPVASPVEMLALWIKARAKVKGEVPDVGAVSVEVDMEVAVAESKTEVLDNQGCGTVACDVPLSRLVSSNETTVRDSKAKLGIDACHSSCGGAVRYSNPGKVEKSLLTTYVRAITALRLSAAWW